MMDERAGRDLRRSLAGTQRLIDFNHSHLSSVAVTVVQLARLPHAQPFLGKLQWEACGISSGTERFGREDTGRLMMSMLTWIRCGIHRHDDFGPQFAHQANELCKCFNFVPLTEC